MSLTQMVELSEKGLVKFKEKFLEELSLLKKDDLEMFKIKYFSRKGEIRKLFQKLSLLPLEKKKKYGEMLNMLSKELETIFEQKKVDFNSTEIVKNSKEETIFFEKTLPGKKFLQGTIHPLQKVLDEIIEVFRILGFVVKIGPEIESEEYNFTKLNIPEHHPARDMQDTLYLDLPSGEQGKKTFKNTYITCPN